MLSGDLVGFTNEFKRLRASAEWSAELELRLLNRSNSFELVVARKTVERVLDEAENGPWPNEIGRSKTNNKRSNYLSG